MSKVIVIERCGDCPYMKWTGETTACLETGMDIDPLSPDFDKYEAGAGMPDWCPLSSLPEKVDNPDKSKWKFDNGYWHGWNDCLDEITGEVEV